jgi:ribosome assembly protein RRB1
MSKRPAEDDREGVPLKGGERLEKSQDNGLEFEDEFEDEFESEDEILEAGVDGRPDAEREAEEKGTFCAQFVVTKANWRLIMSRANGCRPTDFHRRTQ